MPAVQHMVVVKFKPETAQATIDDIYRGLAELPSLIPGITHFSGGPYSSDEGLNGGYTHGFLISFESTDARDNYLPHSEHERVKQQILPHIDGVIAFDFEV